MRGVCLASLRHISGVERILPEGQNTLVFWLSGRRASSTSCITLSYFDSSIDRIDKVPSFLEFVSRFLLAK
jgi:hypothetical protein